MNKQAVDKSMIFFSEIEHEESNDKILLIGDCSLSVPDSSSGDGSKITGRAKLLVALQHHPGVGYQLLHKVFI